MFMFPSGSMPNCSDVLRSAWKQISVFRTKAGGAAMHNMKPTKGSANFGGEGLRFQYGLSAASDGISGFLER